MEWLYWEDTRSNLLSRNRALNWCSTQPGFRKESFPSSTQAPPPNPRRKKITLNKKGGEKHCANAYWKYIFCLYPWGKLRNLVACFVFNNDIKQDFVGNKWFETAIRWRKLLNGRKIESSTRMERGSEPDQECKSLRKRNGTDRP